MIIYNITMQIFVKTLTGKTITLEVEPTDSIQNVKARFRTRGYSTDSKINFAGNSWRRNPSRLQYQKESSLHPVLLLAPRWIILLKCAVFCIIIINLNNKLFTLN